jgi:hypothetical protein
MSAPELPDDPNQWPQNPFHLFGVRPGVSAAELRKAYTRLIRRFKPEQHPEQFRRIREAYERLQEYAESVRARRDDEAPTAAPDPFVERAPPPTVDDDPDRLWRQASTGDPKTAYRRLTEARNRRPGNGDILLRLYWLRTLWPEVDRGRDPCEWLAEGLKANGFAGPLRELYRRELIARPGEALSERCDRLLALPFRSERTAELAGWRWLAASRLSRWRTIAADLEMLRPRILGDAEEVWGGLLLTAAEQLIAIPWPEALELVRQCAEELKTLEHLSLRVSDLFDRFTVLAEAAAGLARLGYDDEQAPQLAPLLALSWGRPFGELRPALEWYLAKICLNPGAAFERLDRLCGVARPLASRLSVLLDWYEASRVRGIAPEHDAEITLQLTREIAARAKGMNFHPFRKVLLEFCVQEALPPEVVAESYADSEWAERLRKDLPLRLVCRACRLFAAPL